MGGVYYPDAQVTLQVVLEDVRREVENDIFGLKVRYEAQLSDDLRDLSRPIAFPIQPMSITVNTNSFKEADTWSVDFDAKDFPFSPDLIRAAACEIYIYGKKGIGDQPRTIATPLGSESDGDGTANSDTKTIEPTIAGLIDNAEIDYDESGRTFMIDGRDYTALFLDKKFVKRVSATQAVPRRLRPGSGRTRIDLVFLDLINEVDPRGVVGLVVVDENGNEVNARNPRTSGDKAFLSSLPNVLSREGRTNKRGIPFPPESSFWDVLQTAAVRVGFITFVRATNVILTKVSSLNRSRSGENAYRKVAWGRNLTNLKMRRKIGKERVPTIEVASYDSKTRNTIVGRYPAKGQKAATGLGTKRDEVRRFVVDNIKSKSALEDIAQNAYELLSRSELTVEFSTDDLLDLPDDPANRNSTRRNMIELRAGDAVAIAFDPFNTEVLQKLESVEERIGFLESKGYPRRVSQVVAENWQLLDTIREPLRVRESTIEWDNEDGISISAECVQFVNVGASGAEP